MSILEHIIIDAHSRKPKYRQIVESIIENISTGKLKINEKIPSINLLSEQFSLSRDTVEKAYNILKERNIITSVKGKGFYVTSTPLISRIKVLFLVNKLSAYKMRIYNSGEYAEVYQDFENDIYKALKEGKEKVSRYSKLVITYPSQSVYPYPKRILHGFRKFCVEAKLPFAVIEEIEEDMPLERGTLYLTIPETDLVNLVKAGRDQGLKPGKDIGIISYNETPLKDLLGITTISTDFAEMGRLSAKIIREKQRNKIKNRFILLDRDSL